MKNGGKNVNIVFNDSVKFIILMIYFWKVSSFG